MKIVIASGTYPDEIGGMATFVKNFAERLQAAGHEVNVIAYAANDAKIKNGFTVKLISRMGGRAARYFRYFLAVMKTSKTADFIFIQDLVSSGLPATCAAIVNRKKTIIRLGGDFLWEQMVERGACRQSLVKYYASPKSWMEKMYLAVYRFVLNRSRAVIFNTRLQAELFSGRFDLRGKLVKAIGNPLPSVQKSEPVSGEDLVYIGRFLKLKNLGALIKSYRSLSPDKKLYLIGEGPELQNLQSQISESGLEGRVIIQASLPRREVFARLKKSYLLIVPSYTELSPNIVLEALSVGAPVLITSENGLPDSIKNNLVSFDPFSERDLARKLRLLFEPGAYGEYKRKISALNFNRGWDEVFREYLEVFQKVT